MYVNVDFYIKILKHIVQMIVRIKFENKRVPFFQVKYFSKNEPPLKIILYALEPYFIEISI